MINIVLYEPEIPQNTGNIMRTCAGTGAKLHLIEPLGFSLSESAVKRCGVNYIENCDYTVYKNWDDFLSKNKGDFYFYTRYGKKPHSDFDYSKFDSDIYLVFGKESVGLPEELIKENFDKCVRIPMIDGVRCLNLSNSVAIAVYELLRQSDFCGLV